MSNYFEKVRLALIAFMLCLAANVSAQTVKGTVVDPTGEPIIGATIMEVGVTGNGSVTDLDGNFSITLKGNQNQLSVSYIGMKTQTVNVSGKSTVNITMEDEATSLNDVVVIGYGSVRKKDLTGSVATVGSDVLEAVPVTNVAEALTGKMAGVQITTTEGSPDAELTVRVRGGGSITQSNDPLYIVDGFPVESINDIAASEIEDITVLKDASSTAIYGSRGANGVILVTTKSGKEGKVSVNYNAYYSWKQVANTMDVLSARDYALWQYELSWLRNGNANDYVAHFGSYSDIDLYDNVATNDWQDLTFGRTGTTFNHNLSISGGSDKLKYTFNYAHVDDKAIMEMSNYSRDNLSLKLKDSIKIDDLYYALMYSTEQNEYYLMSSVTDALRDNDEKRRRTQLNLAGSLTWEIIDDLKFRAEIGYDTYKNDRDRFYGESAYYVRNNVPADLQGHPAAALSRQYRTKIRSTNTLNYDFKKIFGKESPHHLNLLVGHEYILQKNETLSNTIAGYPLGTTATEAWRMTNMPGVTFTEIENFYSPNDIMLSWFGRVNYDFDSKYLLSATFRADGSSKFSEDNRWGFFPSVAVAWRISSEKFMRATQSWLDDLKLRLSYGTAGNNNIPSGMTTQLYEASSNHSYVNGYPIQLAPSSYMANPDLKWETTYTRNIGLDFSLFHSKLTGTIDLYWNNTKDLLIEYPVSGTGYSYQYRNMGETENKGIELSFNYNIVNKR